MDENESFKKIEEEKSKSQIVINESEPTNNFNNQNHHQINPSQNKPLITLPKRSKKNMISLIVIVISILLILSTLILPLYCMSIGMSMIFFFPINMDADVNFHVDKITLNGKAMGNSMQESLSYSELEQKAQEQEKNLPQGFFGMFQIMKIMIIVMLILSIISLIGVLGTIFNFGNKNKMKKIGLLFGILTFILGISLAGYFMIQWDSNTLNQMPSLNSDDSSDAETIYIINPNQTYAGLDNIGFWDGRQLDLDDAGFSDSNDSSIDLSGLSGSFFNVDFSCYPGLSWYFIIYASIISLVSALILLNKRLKIVLLTIFVCSLLLTGAFIYLAFVVAGESSSTSLSSFGNDSDSEEVAKFVGTWELDVNNTVGHNEWSNISKETWIFWENETFNKYEVTTHYETAGSGSMSCIWSVSDNSLELCYGTYDYIFSNDNMKITLTKDDEIIVLNKTVG